MRTTAITHARIYTIDPAFSVIADGTIVFDESGILALGPSATTPSPEAAEVIDGRGRLAVLPGFIDVHSHSSLLKGFTENAQLMDWLPEYQREHQTLTEADAYHACLISYLEAVKGGTTTVMDMYRFLPQGAKAAQQLGLRVHLVPYAADNPSKPFFETLESSIALIEHCQAHYDPAMVTPWLGLEHITYCSQAMFRQVRELADHYGVNIHSHTSEQQEEVAAVQALFGDRPVALFNDWGILKPGSVLAHCVWLDQREIEILAHTGTGVAHCPISNMKLASGPAPLAKLRDAGITIGLGSDGAICNNSLSMFENMKTGSLLQKVTHLDATAVSAEQALRMATIDGARLLGVEQRVGSLELGKQADLFTLDLWQPHLLPIAEFDGHDPVLWNLVFAAQAADVQSVWVAGRPVMQQRELVTVNQDELLAQVHRQTLDLLSRRRQVQGIPMV
ncbi:amidohydrolase [Halioxenophilus sp. WMMB6]|uniref:amidohydrolase family protein n=1 Tax=Halioxenophilus sp. WMMB6 TaxID=3073815 RepID=UPI00295EC71D|nr:amidohydrolase [Halioxenophilus sp. WMMB6]